MDLKNKRVCYYLQLNKYKVYFDDKNSNILAFSHRCLECNAEWNPSYDQCIFCGTINRYLYTCQEQDCGEINSITGSTGTCTNCGSGNLKNQCFNDNCPSNSDPSVNNIVKNIKFSNYNGLFSKGSPFRLSKFICECGCKNNHFLPRTIKVIESEDENSINVVGNLAVDITIFYSTKEDRFLTIKKEDIILENIKNISLYRENVDIEAIFT